MVLKKPKPKCIIIAGPNGAGKTTFAKTYLVADAKVIHFVNADLIAAGLSPLDPPQAARAAGRILLTELERLSRKGESFALESTLSGKTYLPLIALWKERGYRIEIVFLRLKETKLALSRIAGRVRQGGHDVPKADVERRFERGWKNFEAHYRNLADAWWTYEASGPVPVLLDKQP